MISTLTALFLACTAPASPSASPEPEPNTPARQPERPASLTGWDLNALPATVGTIDGKPIPRAKLLAELPSLTTLFQGDSANPAHVRAFAASCLDQIMSFEASLQLASEAGFQPDLEQARQALAARVPDSAALIPLSQQSGRSHQQMILTLAQNQAVESWRRSLMDQFKIGEAQALLDWHEHPERYHTEGSCALLVIPLAQAPGQDLLPRLQTLCRQGLSLELALQELKFSPAGPSRTLSLPWPSSPAQAPAVGQLLLLPSPDGSQTALLARITSVEPPALIPFQQNKARIIRELSYRQALAHASLLTRERLRQRSYTNLL